MEDNNSPEIRFIGTPKKQSVKEKRLWTGFKNLICRVVKLEFSFMGTGLGVEFNRTELADLENDEDREVYFSAKASQREIISAMVEIEKLKREGAIKVIEMISDIFSNVDTPDQIKQTQIDILSSSYPEFDRLLQECKSKYFKLNNEKGLVINISSLRVEDISEDEGHHLADPSTLGGAGNDDESAYDTED